MMGCWFYYTQAIWKKNQILGLGKLYKTGKIYADWLRKLMALPLLPQSEITSTFSVFEAQVFELYGTDKVLVDKFKKYIKKTWILGEKDLSVYSSQIATNNGCESFHKTLKSSIKVHHPNVWKFLTELSKIITDFASKYMRLEKDLQITRPTKRNVIKKLGQIPTSYIGQNPTYSLVKFLVPPKTSKIAKNLYLQLNYQQR